MRQIHPKSNKAEVSSDRGKHLQLAAPGDVEKD